jgi:hypothetical protein
MVMLRAALRLRTRPEEGQRKMGNTPTTRKPRLLLRLSGVFLLR